MNRIFAKCKICLIVLMILVSPNFVFAQTCSSDGYTILTINGIFTDENGALKNRNDLQRNFDSNYHNQPLIVDYVYNPTHLEGFGDLIDAVAQGLFDRKSDYDLTEMLDDASSKVTTQKLLLVAHSQGNFYANNFYDKVAGIDGGVPEQSIGMYGVASPDDRVSGGGQYVTSDTDDVIAATVGRYIKILPPNIHIPLTPDDGNGHSFSDVYLKYQSPRIISDIKSALNNLENNNIQNINGPCIAPQKLTLGHKIVGIALAVADPTATVTKNIVTTTGNVGKSLGTGIVNTSIAFGNGVINVIGKTTNVAVAIGNGILNGVTITTKATINLASSLNKSIVNLVMNNGVQNQANAIDAVIPNNLNSNISKTTNPILPIVKVASQKPVAKIIPNIVTTPNTNTNHENINTMILAQNTNTQPTVVSSRHHNAIPPEPVIVQEEKVVTEPKPEEVPPSDQIVEGENGPDPVVEDNSDKVAPVITISGDNPMYIGHYLTYEETGAKVVDDVDGDITENLVINGTVDTNTMGTYTITYSATDKAGNTATATRIVTVGLNIYHTKSFGTDNGDGRDWQVWHFNGSFFYDWSDTYIDHYLREQFKMQRYSSSETHCSICITRGVFNHNPLEGFELTDLKTSRLEGGVQNGPDNLYDVVLQWDALGYSYNISYDGILYTEGRVDVENINSNTWVGWAYDLHYEPPFTTNQKTGWFGIQPNIPTTLLGGSMMTLTPYPVYVE